MNWKMHKRGEGKYVRGFAVAFLGAFALYGGWFLYDFPSDEGWWGAPVAGVEALERLGITWRILVSVVAVMVVATAIYRYLLVRPGVSDFLIETEGEMRKVSWPTAPEWTRSSIVVILCVVFLGVFLAVADLALSNMMEIIR